MPFYATWWFLDNLMYPILFSASFLFCLILSCRPLALSILKIVVSIIIVKSRRLKNRRNFCDKYFIQTCMNIYILCSINWDLCELYSENIIIIYFQRGKKSLVFSIETENIIRTLIHFIHTVNNNINKSLLPKKKPYNFY